MFKPPLAQAKDNEKCSLTNQSVFAEKGSLTVDGQPIFVTNNGKQKVAGAKLGIVQRIAMLLKDSKQKVAGIKLEVLEATSNQLRVKGWAFGPEESLVLLFNGKEAKARIKRAARQDVLNAFGLPADFTPGFEITLKKPESGNFALGLQCKIGGEVTLLEFPLSVEILAEEDIEAADRQKELATKLTPKSVTKRIEGMIGVTPEPNAREEGDVKLIAYYLPQFHPIPENDEWWGPGFTEWTNVAQAKPYFDTHYQPHVPGELGFYDLRLPEVREAQAKLAREHGVYGFCYYYYWFEGRRLLERPLQDMFESGKPDMPFCICWANENWSRRWDGSENEILVKQVHNEKTDEDFIHDVIPLLKDSRYIKLNGAPLLIIYRLSLLPNPVETAARWRKICAENGIPEIHLCMAETFGLSEPRQFGFDSAVQFPPHNTVAALINEKIAGLAEGYSGNIYDFNDVIKDQLAKEPPTYKRFPGVMTSWDNTARKKLAGNIFWGASPEKYELWLRGAIDLARDQLPPGERLVFINAWNEWAEGAHLEPDRVNGRSYLKATRRALTGQSDWQLVLEYAKDLPTISGETKESILNDLHQALDRLKQVNERMFDILGHYGLPKYWTMMKPGLPNSVVGMKVVEDVHGKIEQINHRINPGDATVVEAVHKMYVIGWALAPTHELKSDTPTYLTLRDIATDDNYYALIDQRVERSDVSNSFSSLASKVTLFSGFKQLVDISNVPAGRYDLAIMTRYEKQVILTHFDKEVEIA